MKAIAYERLDNIRKRTAPYRGTTNRFPIGDRRDSRKYFLVNDENGEQVFDIVYGADWVRKEATEDEYLQYEFTGVGHFRKFTDPLSDETTYSKFVKAPNIVGRVRPDNSFEFTTEHLHQGERGVISNWCTGWFVNDSRRGGVMYRDSRVGHAIPIFQGLRVDCTTMKPVTEYQVVGRKVNRKAGKELLSGYEHFYKVSEVMFKAMEWNTFIDLAVELCNEVAPELDIYERAKADALREEAVKRKDEVPIDAAIMFIVAEDIGRMQWNVRSKMMNRTTNFTHDDSTPEELFYRLKRMLNKKLYKQHDNVFKEVPYEMSLPFPPSEWGVTVTVDGKEVKRYGYGS
jgi:hypothetical protein